MTKHLTLRDRVVIQYEIENNSVCSLQSLAVKINVDPSSLFREIKRNRISLGSKHAKFLKSVPLTCHHLKKFPYVCNACVHRKKCTKELWIYDAVEANAQANILKSESRSHPKLTPSEMKALDQQVSPRIKAGQSISHIVASEESLPISAATLRRYIGRGHLSARNIDLPMTVRFKYQKPPKVRRIKRISIDLLVNRTYQDYLDVTTNQHKTTLQVDLMIGKSTDKVALLTLYEPVSKLQWGVLVNRSAYNINQVLSKLIQTLHSQHRLFFDFILCDNGQEFQQLPQLEMSQHGEILVRVYYCDPYSSFQQAGCERNHALVRRVIKKGESFSLYSQSTIDTIFSNLNSHKRESLNGKSPFEMFRHLFVFCITEVIPLQEIDPKDIILK